MKDHGRVLGGGRAFLDGKEIAGGDLHVCRGAPAANDGCEGCHVAGGPGKAADIAKAAIEQTPHQPRADETGGPGDEDGMIGLDDEGVGFHGVLYSVT